MRNFMLLIVLLLAVAAFSQERTAALFLTGGMEMDGEVAKRLRTEGFTVVTRPLSDPISPEQLKLFELVVVPDFAGMTVGAFGIGDHTVRYLNARRNLGLLQQYVREGGGLFFSPLMAGGGIEVAEGSEALLAPWGAHLLTGQVRDNAHAAAKLPYAWTTAIAKSPITAGVSKLYYPTNQLRWDDAYATVPFAFDGKDWQVLARGMPGSTVAKGIHYTTWVPLEGMQAPPIAAARAVEKGRVAVCGIAPFYTFSHAFSMDDRGWVGESNTGLIDGIMLEKGEDEDHQSDGWTLLMNTFHWLAESSREAGFGGYTKDAFAKLPTPAAEQNPAWMGWKEGNGGTPVKVLIGARTAASDGAGSVREYADAARKAGYGVLALTETFEKLDLKAWTAVVKACDAASDDTLIVMPGMDIPDIFGNRFLVLGTRIYPEKFMLSADGKALKQAQYLSLGFGTHFTIIARPSTTPMPHELYKFFAGIAVCTYKDGALVDDGLLAYQWQVNNVSMPLPVAVHELYSPAEVAKVAASDAHQTYVLAGTPDNAVWYLRPGMAHHWESPALFLVSAGPMVRTLNGGQIVAEDDVPITDVRAISRYVPVRRWTPKENRIDLAFTLPPNQYYPLFFHLIDAKGRTAITPIVRLQWAPGYLYRCSDRQNFFGFAVNYTGTVLPEVDINLPAFGTKEGQGFWPSQRGPRRGENLTPLIDFPFASHAVTITNASIDQRYFNALWEDVVFDGKASQGTTRSRVYEAKVRYYDYHHESFYTFTRTSTRPMMVIQAEIRLRIPVAPEGDVFPYLTGVKAQPAYEYRDPKSGEMVTGRLTQGYLDLPVGGRVEEFVALTPGFRVLPNGRIGFAAPAWTNGALPVGTTWSGRFVKLPPAKIKSLRVQMGLTPDTPYAVTLARGTLRQLAYVAETTAADGAVAGTVQPAPAPTATDAKEPEQDAIDLEPAKTPMTYALPLTIAGLNGNWDTRLWREDGSLTPFAVFEGEGHARLDVTKGGKFYAGPLVTANGAPNLRITVLSWDDKGIKLEVNNPTDVPMEATLETPAEITGKFPLKQQVSVPAGSMKVIEYK